MANTETMHTETKEDTLQAARTVSNYCMAQSSCEKCRLNESCRRTVTEAQQCR